MDELDFGVLFGHIDDNQPEVDFKLGKKFSKMDSNELLVELRKITDSNGLSFSSPQWESAMDDFPSKAIYVQNVFSFSLYYESFQGDKTNLNNIVFHYFDDLHKKVHPADHKKAGEKAYCSNTIRGKLSVMCKWYSLFATLAS